MRRKTDELYMESPAVYRGAEPVFRPFVHDAEGKGGEKLHNRI
jgi:hypothetical protein